MESGVYKIVNLKSDKFYIGSAVFLKKRRSEHLCDLKKGIHANCHLQSAWNLYGEESFLFEILEYYKKSLVLFREQYYLDLYWSTGLLYNICRTAGSQLGQVRSDETKKKISDAKRRKRRGPYKKRVK